MGASLDGQMMVLRLVCVWMVVAVCCASDTSVPESEPATDQGTQFLAEVGAETTRAATVQPALDVMPIDTEEQAEDVSNDTSDEQEWQKMPIMPLDETSRRSEDDDDAEEDTDDEDDWIRAEEESENAIEAAEDEAKRVAAEEEAARIAANEAADNAKKAEEAAENARKAEEEKEAEAEAAAEADVADERATEAERQRQVNKEAHLALTHSDQNQLSKTEEEAETQLQNGKMMGR